MYVVWVAYCHFPHDVSGNITFVTVVSVVNKIYSNVENVCIMQQ